MVVDCLCFPKLLSLLEHLNALDFVCYAIWNFAWFLGKPAVQRDIYLVACLS